MSVTLGVVLAGGSGSRLAIGVRKADVMLAGVTLRDRAVSAISAVCGTVVVVSPVSPAPEASLDSARWIEDAGEGPLSGIVAGLGAVPFDRALVLGVDFPLVRPALLRALLRVLDASHAPAVMSAPGGIPQPLVAAYGPKAARALAEAFARGERSITRAVVALRARIVSDDFVTTHSVGLSDLLNVNTPEDLIAAERTLAEQAAHRTAVRRRRAGIGDS